MADSDDGLFERVAEALGDQYDLIRLLGRGGMASVFLAREHALKRLVAIKVLDPELGASEDFRSRFQREAETAAQLHHPNIVPIYRVGASGDLAYFTMAYVDGESLGARLRRSGRFPVEEALRVTREVTAALGSAHRRGIIHRDIKPANVLFDKESGRAHMTDFGIAQVVSTGADQGEESEDLTVAGMVMGTPRYMSPEQASGERDLTPASDLYAVGILLYEMLSGAYPYTIGPNRNFLVAHLTQDADPLSSHVRDLPGDLEAIVIRLLDKDPAQRFATADDLLAALGSGEVSASMAPRRMRKRGRVMAALAVVLLAVAGGRTLLRSSDGVPDGVDPRKSILLGFFNNTSADRSLDWLRIGGVELLGQSLARWDDLQVIGVDRLLDAARKAGVDKDEPISRDDAFAMARQLGVWTATTGSLVRLNNDSMRITVRVYDVASERELSTATVAVPRDSALTEAFDALGQEILEVAGAPPTAVVGMEPPTHSIDAYRAYIDGILARNRFDLDSAKIAFRRAVDEDPQFALAYYALSSVTSGVQVPSQDPEFLALADSALRYSANRPTKERLLIEAFHAFVNADLVRAQELYRELLAKDSTLADAWAGLGASATYDLTLRVDENGNEYFPSSPTVALHSFTRTLELDANDYRAYPIMTSLLMAASQEEGRLPAFRDPPPGDLTTLGRRVPVEWYQLILQGDSILTVPVDSVSDRFPTEVLDSLRRVARQRAEDLLQRWVSHAPDQGIAWLTLASVQHEEKKYDEAFASLTEARRVGLPSVIPYEVLRLAWLLEAQRFDEALPLADSLAGTGWGPDMDEQHLVQSMPFPNALLVSGRIEDAVTLERRLRAMQLQFPAGPDIKARYQLIPVVMEVRARAAVDQVSPAMLVSAIDSLEAVAAALEDSARVQFLDDIGEALLPGAAALGDTAHIAAFRAEYGSDRYLAIDAWAAVVAGDLALAEVRYQAALQDTTWRPRQVFPLARTAEALGRHDEALAHYSAMDTLNYSAVGGTDTDFVLLVRSYALRAAVYDATGDGEAAQAFYGKFLWLWQDPEDVLREQRDLARQALGQLERQDRPDN